MEVTEGFVLKTFPYGETRFIVHLYSREGGFLRFITPPYVKERKRSLLPMQLCEVEYIKNNRDGLHKIHRASPIKNLSSIFFDPYLSNTAMLWGEVLNTLLRNEQANSALFTFVDEAVELLNRGELPDNFSLFFILRLSSFVGFHPDTVGYERGYLFNLSRGLFTPPGSNDKRDILTGPNTAEAFYRFCTEPIEQVAKIRLDEKSRNLLFDTLLSYYEIHLDTTFDKKTIEIIRETCGI